MSYPNNDSEKTFDSSLPPSFPSASGSTAAGEGEAAPAAAPAGDQGRSEHPHHSPYPTAQQHMVHSGPVYGATPQQGGYYPQPSTEQSWAWAPKWALGLSIFNVVISLIPILNVIIMSVTSIVGLVLCVLALVGISKDPQASKTMAIVSVALFLLSGVTLVLSYLLLAVVGSM